MTHHTNLALSQSVPLELEVGTDITLKVKVSCPEGCDLRGIPIKVMAPAGGLQRGPHARQPRVGPERGSRVGHAAASAAFSFRTARPPGYRVTVKVTEKDTETPLENVGVRLGMYQALTDAQGLASLEVPGGVYNLDAWKAGYETLPRTVKVGKDLMVQVEALSVPEKDPDDTQVWM